MTTTKNYEHFIVSFRKNDKVVSEFAIKYGEFAAVKKHAIEMLKERVKASRERDDHDMIIYGAILVNKTSSERMSLGFSPQWKCQKVEKLYSL